MPRFSASVLLRLSGLLALSFFSSNSYGQTVASTTAVTAVPTSGSYGTAVAISAGVSPSGMPVKNGSGGVVLPTGTVRFFDGTTALTATPTGLTSPTGLSSTPFASVFGTLDSSFGGVYSTLAADFNGDGTQDLLAYENKTYMANGAFAVQSFISKSGGGFTPLALQTLTLPSLPAVYYTPLAVDVDGDGKLDLLFGTAVAYGNGDGTFRTPVTPSFLGSEYVNTYVADVTGDGKPDLIALQNVTGLLSSGNPVALQVTVFVNQGGGNFQAGGTYTLASFSCLIGCDSATLASLNFVDLNGDGALDMVAQTYFVPAGNSEEPAILISLLNNGNGTFAPSVPINYNAIQNGGSIELSSLQAEDFNKDGKVDLALIYPTPSTTNSIYQTSIIFLPGNGDGTFGSETDSNILTSVPPAVQAPAGNTITADVNLDGSLDLVFGNGAEVIGDGKGGFAGTSATLSGGASVGTIQLSSAPLPSFVFGVVSQPTPGPPPPVASYNLISTASLATSMLSPGMHSITAQYSGDSNYAASTSAPAVVNITAMATTTAINSSSNPAYRGETATITISVHSSGSIPTGTVAVTCTPGPMTGLTCPSPSALDAQGNASFQLSNTGSLAGGVAITAVYSGDANHASSTASLTQVFDEPVTISPSTGTITVQSGGSASVALSVTGYAGYTGPATFTCTGLPADASCVFNPSPTNVTGAAAQTVTLTVSTSRVASASVKPLFGQGLQTLVCGFFAGSLLLLWPRRRWTHWIGILVIGLGLIPLGCGGNSSRGGSSSANTPPGSYPLTIVGPNAGQQEGAQFTLVVQ